MEPSHVTIHSLNKNEKEETVLSNPDTTALILQTVEKNFHRNIFFFFCMTETYAKAYEPSVSVPSGFIFFKLLFYSLLFKYFVYIFSEAFLQSLPAQTESQL